MEDGEEAKDIKMKSVGSRAKNNSKWAGFKKCTSNKITITGWIRPTL